MSRAWGHSAIVRGLYRVTKESDLKRVGCHPMKGRLRIGDYLLCVQHAGDHFYRYKAVEATHYADGDPDCWNLMIFADVPAYSLGVLLGLVPLKEFRLLLANGQVDQVELFSIREDY